MLLYDYLVVKKEKGVEYVKKKGAILFFSMLLLGACGTGDTEEGSETSVDTAMEVQSEETNAESSSAETADSSVAQGANSGAAGGVNTETETTSENQSSETHTFDGVVHEETFTTETGYQAWTDYSKATSQYNLGDILNYANPEGTTISEIDQLMDDNLEKAEAPINETEQMVFYRYLDEELAETTDLSPYVSEIAYYFVDEQLMFSSVTPTYYQVNQTDAHDIETLSSIATVSELEELQPQVFTVAEMKLNGETIKQIMVPSQPAEDQSDVMLNAYYLFVIGDDVIHSMYVPFTEVAQDFPSSSIIIFNSFFSWLSDNQ